jgi:hypothetical protein
MLPIILIIAALGAGAYAYSQSNADSDGATPKKKKAPPKRASDLLPPGSPEQRAKLDAVKAQIETLKAKANQGDKDAGKLIDDLKSTWGNLTK